MKIYTKILLDKNNKLLHEEFFNYEGKFANAMGIHYDYKSTKSAKLMEKQLKRQKKLEERKAKREEKEGVKKEDVKEKSIDSSIPLSLEAITNPNKE